MIRTAPGVSSYLPVKAHPRRAGGVCRARVGMDGPPNEGPANRRYKDPVKTQVASGSLHDARFPLRAGRGRGRQNASQKQQTDVISSGSGEEVWARSDGAWPRLNAG